MKKIVLFFACFFVFTPFVYAAAIDSLTVGSKFDIEDIQDVSSYFKSYEIQENDEIYNRIYSKSFPTHNEISLDSIRYLKMIYYNYDKEVVVGEMIVNKNLVDDVLSAFQQLFENHIEIYSMRLIDDFYEEDGNGAMADELSMKSNNTSAFNYRMMTASNNLSNHALGFAIDVNPLENPYVSGRNVQPNTSSIEYYDPTKREENADIHVIKKNDTIYQIFTNLGFTWGGDWRSPKDYQHFEKKVDETVQHETENKNVKKIMLIAAHGSGADCNHAYTTLNGQNYYENIEARKMIEKIAEYFDKHGIDYEIANQIVGDSYWADDVSTRNAARNCTNPNTNHCCGFLTSTIGTYSSKLYEHVDKIGRENYSLAFELHFNGSVNPKNPGNHTSTILKEGNYTKEQYDNSLKISQTVVDTIGTGTVQFHTDKEYTGMNLGTLGQFYVNRSIPTYYLETVFMDNKTQFQAYLDHRDELAISLAKTLIEIAPQTTSTKNHKNNGRFVDPYPNIFGKINMGPLEDYGCDTLFFDEYGNPTDLKNFIDDLFFIIRIVTPIVIIILSTIDYVSAIGEQDKVKKVTQKMMKRVVIGLIIFFLPYFLDLLFHLFGLYDLSRCGIGV